MVGRKRHILTDTLGLLLAVSGGIRQASKIEKCRVQRRCCGRHDAASRSLSASSAMRAIGAARWTIAVARTGTWKLQIVRRCDQHRFVVPPKRLIVERTIAWISRCRRLARDYERHTRKAAALLSYDGNWVTTGCPRRHDPPLCCAVSA